MSGLITKQLNKFDNIAYKLHKTQDYILTAIKSCSDIKEKTYSMEDIDGLLLNIEINSKKIKNSLKQKNLLKERISARMDLFICSKKSMSQEQMNAFKEYNDISYIKNDELVKTISLINDKNNVKKLSNQILLNNENYGNIYNELDSINQQQLKAISILNDIIEKAEKVINIL